MEGLAFKLHIDKKHFSVNGDQRFRIELDKLVQLGESRGTLRCLEIDHMQLQNSYRTFNQHLMRNCLHHDMLNFQILTGIVMLSGNGFLYGLLHKN